MRAIEIIEAIQAATPEDKVLLSSLLNYETTPVTADLVDNDVPAWKNVNDLITNTLIDQFIYNLPVGSETPIVLDLEGGSIKFGTDDPIDISMDLSKLRANPTILFEVITSELNTSPKPPEPWITNKEWYDNTYTSLSVLTIQPDTDTGLPGGLTLDNINIIIKP